MTVAPFSVVPVIVGVSSEVISSVSDIPVSLASIISAVGANVNPSEDTVIVDVCVAVAPSSSVTTTVTVASPLKSGFGVNVIVPSSFTVAVP